MSRSLYVCAIDLPNFLLLAGEASEASIASIIRQNRDRLESHDRYFSQFPGIVNYTSLSEVLIQVLSGKIRSDTVPRFQFEHALALLADTLGERLDPECFLGSSPTFWDEVDSVISSRLTAAKQTVSLWPKLSEIFTRGPYVDLPLDLAWPLGSGYMESEEVADAVQAANKCDLDNMHGLEHLEWPDEALEGARQYREWLQLAASKNLGLYFHG